MSSRILQNEQMKLLHDFMPPCFFLDEAVMPQRQKRAFLFYGLSVFSLFAVIKNIFCQLVAFLNVFFSFNYELRFG